MKAARALAVAVAAVMAACGGTDGPPAVAATVSGVEIGSERVERLTTQWVKSQTAQAAQSGAAAGKLDRNEAAKQVLGFVIRSVFLEQVAAGMGIQDDPDGLEALASEQVPTAEFESAGWSKADLEQSLRDGRLSKAIGEKVFPTVAVSDVELRQKYDRSRDFFNQTWRTQARVAYFDSVELARTLQGRGLVGEGFDAAARELGARQAGSLGLVTPITPLPQPVLAAVGGLAAGQISDPVPAGTGYLVVAADSREERPPMTFEDARPALSEVLEDEQRQKLFYDWFNKRLAEIAVKVSSYYGKWNSNLQLVV